MEAEIYWISKTTLGSPCALMMTAIITAHEDKWRA